ncbi:MAG: UDP-N-acetylmuramate dehydrogenase [Smithella sp.]|nr:UDP-N-acetylmuramate dehydrogenase [Smithella sp.]
MTAKNEMKDVLGDMDCGRILYDEPMSLHTSLAVGGKAEALVFAENEDQLAQIIGKLSEHRKKYFIAGNLTNVIVRDGGYQGAIVLMTGFKDVTCEPAGGGKGFIYAQAGAALSSVVHLSITEELTGLEFCSGIPGSVGGAVWMNAGAYGREMKDVVESVTVLEADGVKKTMKRNEIIFGYRNTSFPRGTVILGALLKLEKGERSKIKETINEILLWRREKHPLDFPSAGSIFKNLPGQAAGKIIEESGLKGMAVGGAQISSKHANFIINRGGATAADIMRLIETVQSRVKKEKNLVLDTEVVIVGEDE